MKLPKAVLSLRKQFPLLRGKLYFNHGAISVMPTSVRKACAAGIDVGTHYMLDLARREAFFALRDETRKMGAELIGAKPRNMAFVDNTSTALSLISQAVPWRKGDNVVTGSIENPATVVPWQNMAHRGVRVRFLPADRDDLVDLAALPRLVDRRTRLVALSLVQYSTGQRMDLAKVVRFCRPRGILVSADAVQAVGAVPIDVKALGVNFLSFGAQKWIMGPRHVGMMYIDDRALRVTHCPIVTEDSVKDIGAEEQEPTTGVPQLYVPKDATKFEAGPYSNFTGVCGLHQALKNLFAMGPAALYRRLREITDELVEGLASLDGRVVSPRGENEWSGIVSFALNRAEAKAVHKRLIEKGVYIAVRKGRLRICPHYYNTSEEVARFLAALQRACA